MENYNLKLTSNIIAGCLITMGSLFTLVSCIMMFTLDDFVFALFLVFSVPFLIWGLVAKGRKFMCNNEQFEAVGCAEEVKSGYEEIKVKIPQLTLRWDSVKSYSYQAGYGGGYVIVNTLDEKKYRIKIAYMSESSLFSTTSGFKIILEQFESRFGTSKTVAEQKKKQNTWVAVAIILGILLLMLKNLI